MSALQSARPAGSSARSEADLAREILRDLNRAVEDPAPLPRRWQRALGRIDRAAIRALCAREIDSALAVAVLTATGRARAKSRRR